MAKITSYQTVNLHSANHVCGNVVVQTVGVVTLTHIANVKHVKTTAKTVSIFYVSIPIDNTLSHPFEDRAC